MVQYLHLLDPEDLPLLQGERLGPDGGSVPVGIPHINRLQSVLALGNK